MLYAKYEAMLQFDCNFLSRGVKEYAASLFYDDDARVAYIKGATETLEELKTVLSVNEDKYLRENLNKMIKYLEGEE